MTTDSTDNDSRGAEDSTAKEGRIDNEWYFYQNVKTGHVSNTPLSIRQLIKLLVPVRSDASVPPILPSTTQVVKVVVQQQQREQQDEEESPQKEQSSSPSFGQWTSVAEIDILKEASCQQWYFTSSGSSASSNQQPQGPCSCRRIMEEIQQQDQKSQVSAHLLVFAQNITSEWTDVTKLPNLQLVLTALQDSQQHHQVESSAYEATTDQNVGADDEEGVEDQKRHSKQVQDDLEAFLRSTDADGGGEEDRGDSDDDENDDDGNQHMFEADDGMRYIRDPITGNWIHEGLAPTTSQKQSTSKSTNKTVGVTDNTSSNESKNGNDQPKIGKKKHKKSQFAKRNAKQWVYVSGLPTDDNKIDIDDVQRYFSKAGMLDLDPETLKPKIKLYRDHTTNRLKGDASICYARPESVDLALKILDESLWDEHHRIKVEPAHFEAKKEQGREGDDNADGDDINNNKKRKIQRRPVSEAQRKVARLALLQAQDDGFGERLAGGRKGLRIIVIKNIMDGIPDSSLEHTLHEICKEYGDVEKITCISRTQVVIVKFVEPLAASAAIQALNGSTNTRSESGSNNKRIEAIYWDGVTDYTTLPGDEVKELEEEEKRHDDFGNWIDSQDELPPELQLQVAAGD